MTLRYKPRFDRIAQRVRDFVEHVFLRADGNDVGLLRGPQILEPPKRSVYRFCNVLVHPSVELGDLCFRIRQNYVPMLSAVDSYVQLHITNDCSSRR